LDPSKLTRALLGPILVLVVLLGVGYGAVVWEHSHPVHLTVQAVSMKFVSNQGTSRVSNTWPDMSEGPENERLHCRRSPVLGFTKHLGSLLGTGSKNRIQTGRGQFYLFDLGIASGAFSLAE